MKHTEFVLWGKHPQYANGVPIKITGGTVRECSSALRQRQREGWSGLAVLPAGAGY